ncbi:MAG: SDR family NAD(P)-dependent oxidoreductase [Burkholderiales bacterium]|nr:SDR family NAD(P)-dependent oxidoreductase [Burkholderiales bacterium]
MDVKAPRPLAVVTGASSGIGLQLARCAIQHGYDLVVAADMPLDDAVGELRGLDGAAKIDPVQADLASQEGVEELLKAVDGRRIDALMANAGHGLGGAFLDQDFNDVQHVIDTNITGTIYLLQRVARLMKMNNAGRILVTGSIAGFQPGAFQAVYNGTKAFIDSFVAALRNEIKDTKVTLSCLMPGVTDTDFFERAGMLDTKVGASDSKMDPADVAEIGFKAMLKGEADVVAGLKNKLTVAMSKVMPSQVVAQQHRKMAEPGSADKK